MSTLDHRMRSWLGAPAGLVRASVGAGISLPDGSVERARERSRRIALTAIVNGAARAISIASLFVSIPLTLHYLGPERYGMWVTMSALASLLSFLDLGVGNGLLNAVAFAYGRNDSASIRRYSSSALAILVILAGAVILLFLLIRPFVDWAAFFNVRSETARADATVGATAFVLIFAVSIPVSVVQRIQLALQRGFVASLWQCAASAVGLAGILGAIALKAGLGWLLLASFGAPLAMSVLNGIVFFVFVSPELAPSFDWIERSTVKRLAATGSNFFLLQITAPLTFAFDAFIISRLMGAANVPQYALPEKMFSVVSIILSFFMMPLWPAYGEAFSRGDKIWVQDALVKSVRLSILAASAWSAALLLFGNRLLALWVGSSIHPALALFVGLALWKVVEAWGVAMATFLNGCNIIRLQVWCGLMTAFIATTLKLLLVPRVGIAGIVWGTLVASVFGIILPFALSVRGEISRRLMARPGKA